MYIMTDNNSRVVFTAVEPAPGLINVVPPTGFTPAHMYDYILSDGSLVYNPVPPEPDEPEAPSAIETLRADVDYLLMITEEA